MVEELTEMCASARKLILLRRIVENLFPAAMVVELTS